MKKIISLVLSIIMIASCFCTFVSAEYANPDTDKISIVANRTKVKVGDIIIDGRTRFNIGTVIEVDDSIPFYVDVFDEETNETVRAEHPDHHTLRLKIKTKAIKRNGAYYIQSQDFRLAVGLSVPMQAPDLCKSGFISDIQISKK